MSVREKAKAFEGHASDDSDTHPNVSPPIPPPRKYKKNGTLRQAGDSSPSTEIKKNIPKPASSSSLPTKQSNVTEQKKKPKPPPPTRGSSLRRKAVMSINLESGSSGKKPRPPIPPKPKNYVPKRKSLGRDITVNNKVQQDVRSTKEIMDSAPVVPDSGQSDHRSSQSYFNLEEGNYTGNIHPKILDSENSSQFFVPVGKNVPSDTSERTGIKASSLTGGETIHSLENGRADQLEVHENGVALPQAKSVFYDHKILSPDEDSGKESPDLLEGLEIDVEPFSEDDEEDLNKAAFGVDKENLPLSDSKGFNAIVARDDVDVVVKKQPCGELMPSDRGNDSKENVKVMFSLVLEEECSVSMIDDPAESQKLVGIVVNETTNFEQTTEGEASDGINQININELSNKAKHDVGHKLWDAAVEVTTSQECQNVSNSIVAESLHASDIDIESSPKVAKVMEENSILDKIDTDEPSHICDLDIESSREAAKAMEENSISDNLDADEPLHTHDRDIESSPEAAKTMAENSMSDNLDADQAAQQNICVAVTPVEELSQTSLEQKELLEGDLHLESQGHEVEKNEEESSNEIVTSASTDLARSEAQENRDIIVAEPIREGTFISVSDHGIFEGKAEVTEASAGNKSGTEVSDSCKRCGSVPDITVVTNTDFETPMEEDKAEFEDEQEVNASQIHSNINEISSEVNLENFKLKMDSEENSREHLLIANVNEVVAEDSTTNSKEPEELESEKIPSASVAEHTLGKTAEDAAVSSVDDFGHSTKILEDTEITATHIETVDNEEEQESEECRNGDETQPSSPEPVPPERPNRKSKRGRHAYENVDLRNSEVEKQADEKRSDSLARRAHSFSKYETVVHSLPRPVQRVSDDVAIYRVPSKVIPVRSYGDDDAVYSVPFAIPARCVVEENKYSVPKPIVVQASAVTERLNADEGAGDVPVYAVPGLPTAVPITERSVKKVSEMPQESDSTYAVPGKQTVVPTVTATTSTVPPPKPPRLSLVFEQDKKEKVDVVKISSAESPKPVPRTRGAGNDVASEVKQPRSSPTPAPRKGNKIEAAESPTPKVKEQKASPSPVPRKGSKTEASESETKEHRASPSLVPRKGSKTAETSETPEPATPQGNGSPAPVPRSRLNALLSTHEAASPLPVPMLSSDVSIEESVEEEGTPKHKARPPPRPPPPATRISFTNNDGTMPTPLVHELGNDLESDSDSDVGVEEAPKGPPKPKTFFIAHEILSTERTFVDALKLVFEECYGTIKSANIVADSVLADIFRDLENIYLLDSRFLQELEERMATWEEHERIGDIIKRYGHFLKMYTQYVNGYDKAMAVFQDTMKENPEFADLVTQFQASERCHGMILSSYMLKPVQRIPSYRLLLIDYLKHLPKDSEEFKDTETTLKIVSEVATHINESMKKMDSFEQLLKLQNMLVGNPEIVKAGRDYLREGMLMKLCRKDMQERMFFLLTDVLLYTTPIGGNQFKLNKMLPLLGMQVTVPESPDMVYEFSIISTTRSFTLTASTPEERDDWVEALNKAIDEVTKRKITFVNKTRDAAGLLEQEGDTTKLGEKAPVWIPDARVTMCMSCTKPFTVTNRRHHCRACGNVVCGSCSESTAPLAYLDYTQARVCDKCYDLLLKEFHTDEIHVDLEEPAALPPLLQEADTAEKLLRKPTKFEMMRRFKSRKTKRKSQIMHPTHLTEVVANQEGIQMSGYLRCKKGRYGWKKSWFVLKDSVVYSYKASSDVVALDTLPVLGYTIDDLGKEGDDFVFQLKHKGVPPIIFKADNETSAKRWIEELTNASTM